MERCSLTCKKCSCLCANQMQESASACARECKCKKHTEIFFRRERERVCVFCVCERKIECKRDRVGACEREVFDRFAIGSTKGCTIIYFV